MSLKLEELAQDVGLVAIILAEQIGQSSIGQKVGDAINNIKGHGRPIIDYAKIFNAIFLRNPRDIPAALAAYYIIWRQGKTLGPLDPYEHSDWEIRQGRIDY